MKAVLRFIKRVWFFNRNVEQRRQFKALERSLKKYKKLWDSMTDEQRIRMVRERKLHVFTVAWDFHKLTNSFFDNIEDSV